MKKILLFVILLWLFPATHAQQQRGTYIESLQMPCYPPMARVARVEGTVQIKLTRSANGSVTSAEGVGHGLLKDATIENVRTWKFAPFKGQHPPEPAVITFEYKLEDSSDGNEGNRCATRVTFQSWSRVTVVSTFFRLQ